MSGDDFFKQILRNKEIRDWAFNQHRYQEKQREIAQQQKNKNKQHLPSNLSINQNLLDNQSINCLDQSKPQNKQLKFWRFLNKCNQINHISDSKEEEQPQFKPQQQSSQSRMNQKVLFFDEDEYSYEEKKIGRPCKPRLFNYAELKQGMVENIKNLEKIFAVNEGIITKLQKQRRK